MIHIYCDGGLGNRLFLMISALCFTKEAGKDFIIHWPSNNWTGCYFTDLFDNKYDVGDPVYAQMEFVHWINDYKKQIKKYYNE